MSCNKKQATVYLPVPFVCRVLSKLLPLFPVRPQLLWNVRDPAALSSGHWTRNRWQPAADVARSSQGQKPSVLLHLHSWSGASGRMNRNLIRVHAYLVHRFRQEGEQQKEETWNLGAPECFYQRFLKSKLSGCWQTLTSAAPQSPRSCGIPLCNSHQQSAGFLTGCAQILNLGRWGWM